MSETLSQDDLRHWIVGFAGDVLHERDHLDELDSATGDGEHGSNLCQGMSAVLDALSSAAYPDVQKMFESIGMTVVNNVGGASGALYGTLFLRFSDPGQDRKQLGLDQLIEGFSSGLSGIRELGRCGPGDKTMVDALHPAVTALSAARGQPLPRAVEDAAEAALAGRDATAAMRARRGRGSYLGDRSVGHVDAGATSMAMLFDALRRTVRA